MAITALQLITKSYYLSQVVSRELQTVSGPQINDGLYLLNVLLDVKGSDIRLIPYFERYAFPTIAGQEEYFIPNLLSIEAITFNDGVVRYAMNKQTRKKYFGEGRIDDVTALPFDWHQERELGGTRIYLYFLPQQVYTVKLSGKFGLTDVDLSTDLETVYDKYYIEYLRYALAEYICSDYAVTFPEQAAMKFKEIRKKLLDVSAFDLSIQKSSTLGGAPGLNWGDINIGKGYRPY